jgi:two-component system OmpR family sensor kinase
MNLRARVTAAATAITAVTFALAFPAVFYGVNALEERQLDSALLEEANTEAMDGRPLALRNRPAPAVGKLGPLTKYGALYGADGALKFATSTFDGETPPLPGTPESLVGQGFNFRFRREYLRGVVVSEPNTPGGHLLLAVPRSYLDGDDDALVLAMWVVFALAVAWAGLVTAWVVGRLTRYHEAIAAVTRRVARGDLSARVGEEKGDPQSAQLARDIDEMISRLAQLVGSQKRFIAYAAHELRSPLTMLYGELAHARHGERDADSYRATIEEAFDATKRLKVLTEDLLELARLSVHRRITTSRFEVKELLGPLVKATRADALEKRVSVVVTAPELSLNGCLSDLERLVRNLIENAIRHSPEGGTVEVSASATPSAVEICVADQGPGIPPGEEERIFEPFYRGSAMHGGATGTGLGLAIAREIARNHEGDISVTSAPSGGARFVVYLPSRGPA